MYTKKQLRDYLYFDIETKPKWKHFDDMPKPLQKIWLDKYHFKALDKERELRRKQNAITLSNILQDEGVSIGTQALNLDTHLEFNPTVNEIYIKEAGLHAEYAEIFCISFGVFDKDFNKTINTVQDADEKVIIKNFLKILHHFDQLNLFGYNIDEFDIPFFLKRMWYNGITENYPPQLQLLDAKPWTVKHIDHMKNVKGMSWASITLDLLCEVLNIQTSKDEFSNAEFTTLINSGVISVADGIRYCEKDIEATMEQALAFASDNSNYAPEPKKWGAAKKVATTVTA